MLNIANEAGITALQLHGDESPAYCRELAKDRYVIKTLAVANDFDLQTVAAYEVEAIMLDTKHFALRGGTGLVFDWSIAREVNKRRAEALSRRRLVAGQHRRSDCNSAPLRG